MSAEVIVIGDEIMYGHITDTNSGFISRRLTEHGQDVVRVTKVGDALPVIVQALANAQAADIVVTCGGLGPTHDDRTRDAVAQFLNTELELNHDALNEIETMYKQAGRTMSDANRVQAMIPTGAAFLSNRRGTAPGIRFTKGRATFFCLQGVPKEMEWMMQHHVIPFVEGLPVTMTILHRTIRTVGIPESVLFEKIRGVVERHRNNVDVAFLPQMTRGVDIRLTVSSGADRETAARKLSTAETDFVENIGNAFRGGIYGFDDERLEDVTAKLFLNGGKTIATAESCTGGLIAHRLTNVSGSSAYFMEGAVTYSNESKHRQLAVSGELISKHGAVSEEVVRAMAEGIRMKAGTDLGLATTGIAGPTGGTETKPVGLAYVALASAEGTQVRQITPLPFGIDRLSFKERLSTFAIDMVRRYLIGLKP